MNNIEKYFEGERLQCLIGMLVSAICLGSAIYFFILQKRMFKGISYSSFPLSFILFCICTSIVLRTQKGIKRVTNFHQSAPQKMKTEELRRLKKVIKTFNVLKKIEILLFGVSVCLTIVFWNNHLIRGIAIGIAIQTMLLYTFDTIAEGRSKIYLEYLQTS